MHRPCVRVKREAGERTRRELDAVGLRDEDASIESDGDFVYIPVTDPSAVSSDHVVVERAVTPRQGRTLPTDILGYTPTYERLGDLVLLQEEDPERAAEAARAFMSSDLPIEGVLNRASDVEGEYRVPRWTVLAGDRTETVHREYGAEFLVDPTEVYFSPRLATERHRVIQQVNQGERVVDMFAGVGPYAIRAALAGAEVVAVDINPAAIAYLHENARRNGVDDAITIVEEDVAEAAVDFENWADRLIMNLPHSADQFLDSAVTLAADTCRLHYYDIQPEAAAFGPAEQAVRGAFEPGYDVSMVSRQTVRSYAPGVVNVCLDVDVIRR